MNKNKLIQDAKDRAARNRKELFPILARAVGCDPRDFDMEAMQTIITIGQGIYWSKELHMKAIDLARHADAVMNSRKRI